ncbi:MAG: hypothetical protein LIO87_10935 [Eubacterium sp.]|nr:hypothetical protein [Eubacterium sp.]
MKDNNEVYKETVETEENVKLTDEELETAAGGCALSAGMKIPRKKYA